MTFAVLISSLGGSAVEDSSSDEFSVHSDKPLRSSFFEGAALIKIKIFKLDFCGTCLTKICL